MKRQKILFTPSRNRSLLTTSTTSSSNCGSRYRGSSSPSSGMCPSCSTGSTRGRWASQCPPPQAVASWASLRKHCAVSAAASPSVGITLSARTAKTGRWRFTADNSALSTGLRKISIESTHSANGAWGHSTGISFAQSIFLFSLSFCRHRHHDGIVSFFLSSLLTPSPSIFLATVAIAQYFTSAQK